MKRIGILTAGDDTPALNATIHGAVIRANQLKVEIVEVIKGLQLPIQPAGAACAAQPVVSGHSGTRPHQRRHPAAVDGQRPGPAR